MAEAIDAHKANFDAGEDEDHELSPAPSLSFLLWHGIRADWVVLFGILVMLSLVFVALFAPLLAPFNPMEQNLAHSLRPPFWAPPEGGFHIFGTDPMGRDVLSRIIYGTRISLFIGTVTVIISAIVGLIIGMASGYMGGKVDFLLMRLVDFVLAFPFILIALAFIAIMGPSIPLLCLVMPSRIWIVYARMVRAQTLQLRELEFITAARALGASTFRIIFHHVLPNVVTPCIIIASLYLGRMIILESALSFLGLGVPPPTVSWGGMLAEGRDYIFTSWWIITFPGLVILLAALSAQIIGDWLTVLLDPRMRGVD